MNRECKNCGVKIPVRMKINGKLRNIQRRKFCLSCSPFGLHNTKKVLNVATDFICETCNRHYQWVRNKGGTQKQCNSCWTKKRRDSLKEKYKTEIGGQCKRCGYKTCQQALHFHHIDPSTKLFEIAGSYNMKKERVEAEIKKCILICANCHSELHCGLWKIEDLECPI